MNADYVRLRQAAEALLRVAESVTYMGVMEAPAQYFFDLQAALIDSVALEAMRDVDDRLLEDGADYV